MWLNRLGPEYWLKNIFNRKPFVVGGGAVRESFLGPGDLQCQKHVGAKLEFCQP